jgi:hypothetical protein
MRSILLRTLIRVGLPLAAATLSTDAAHAAEYHCNGDGYSWTSRVPCPNTRRNEMRAYGGGAPAPGSTTSYAPPLPKAPDYLPYMSVECAQLNDAIRTGPARGLQAGPMGDLQADYRKRCSDDESAARQQLREVEEAQKDQRQRAVASSQAEKTRATINSEQCYEMLRILHGKRQRAASMNDGEKADLQRFEDNYKTRCTRG